MTTPVGSATVFGGFDYVESVQSFPVSATLSEVVYDQSRQRLYAADYNTNIVDVFDLAGQKYLTPITVGNSPQGLAITPDSTTLAVTNGADDTLSIVDLTGVTATKTVSLSNIGLPGQCGQQIPYAVAATSRNQAVVAVTCGSLTVGEFVVVDLATQAIGCGASQGCAAMLAAYPQATSEFLFLAATPDGTKIFTTSENMAGLWNVPADTLIAGPTNGAGFAPVVVTAAASDGTAFAVAFGIVDPTLYVASLMQDVDYLFTGVGDVNVDFGERTTARSPRRATARPAAGSRRIRLTRCLVSASRLPVRK